MQSVLFFGTSAFALPILESLRCSGYHVVCVVTQPDKTAGRDQRIVPSPVKTYALQYGFEIFQPAKLSHPEVMQFFSQRSFDVGVVASYGKIIPESLLRLPSHGLVNIHPSLLPALRGPAPIQYALLQGLSETGVTFMLMDKGIDTGPILFQRQVSIPARATFESLTTLLSQQAARDIHHVLQEYVRGVLRPEQQSASFVSYSKMISKADGEIHWNNSAETIDRMIRAFFPWPSAFTFWNGLRVKISAAHPGNDGCFVMRCGRGTFLVIEKLQPAGKKSLSSAEFLRGYKRFLPQNVIVRA